MADFCYECNIKMFGKDFKDFAGLCDEGERVRVLCEGCGDMISVDHNGKRIDEKKEGKNEHEIIS